MNRRTRNRPVLAGLLALAATIGLALAPSPAAPQVARAAARQATDDSRIFFVCNTSTPTFYESNICVMNGDGSDRRQLTAFGVGDLQLNSYSGPPTVSPDGSKILFSGFNRSDYINHLYVMNDDGSNIQAVMTFRGIHPGWSPDGSKIVFAMVPPGTCCRVQLFVVDAAPGSTPGQLTDHPEDNCTGASEPDWSPDGTEILYVSRDYDAAAFTCQDRLVKTRLSDGATVELFRGLSFRGPTWSPDGSKIAFEERIDPDFSVPDLFVANADGSDVRQIPNSGSGFRLTWSPDGSQIAFQQGSPLFGIGIVNADGTGSVRTVGVPSDAHPDWAPARPRPIIFVHGFLGSKIVCGGDELWPQNSLRPFNSPDDGLLAMRLAADGVSNLASGCSPQVGGIVDTVFGSDVYKSTVDFLQGIAPRSNYVFTWDWRTSPAESLARLDAFVDQVRSRHGNAKVVLMAHSMGGLLTRWYVDDQARADKVARVLTIGTPYWGSPKALFPLAAGIESPQASTLDPLLENENLREFASNLLGAYFLYPSANYGPWLTLAPPGPGTLDRAGLLAYVGNELFGNQTLLARALDAHATTLDGFKTNGVDYRVVVGTGLNTISGITIDSLLGQDFVRLTYSTGDGTVPARSGVQGTPGTTDPLGENVPISYACGVSHVPLPGDPKVDAAIKGFLLAGADIKGLSTTPCSASGFQITVFPVQIGLLAVSRSLSLTSTGTAGALTLEEAELQDLAQVLELPNQTVVVTDASNPVDLALPSGSFRLEVTPLLDGAEGPMLLYGPLDGQVTISAAGTLTVTEDGQEVQPGGRDTTAPATEASVSPSANANGWNNTNVSVALSASDNGGSGVKEIVYTRGGAQTVVAGSTATVPVEAEGMTTLTYFARDNAGNTEAEHTLTLSIDKTPPTISCPTPAPRFTLGQTGAAVEANATDALSGPVAGNPSTAADTTSVGAKSVTFSTEDHAGNNASKTCSYSVAYAFDGFFRPVDNADVLNVVKAGQAVPLKWRLTDAAGTPVTHLATAQVTVQSLSCSLGTTEDLVEELAAGASGLQNLGNGNYQLNWKMSSSYAGSCKTLRLDLGEGSFRTALFKFTK
jgi:Tol biopolymer transport system component/pimeloyl-ACP methyl ester carboxylesterase